MGHPGRFFSNLVTARCRKWGATEHGDWSGVSHVMLRNMVHFTTFGTWAAMYPMVSASLLRTIPVLGLDVARLRSAVWHPEGAPYHSVGSLQETTTRAIGLIPRTCMRHMSLLKSERSLQVFSYPHASNFGPRQLFTVVKTGENKNQTGNTEATSSRMVSGPTTAEHQRYTIAEVEMLRVLLVRWDSAERSAHTSDSSFVVVSPRRSARMCVKSSFWASSTSRIKDSW